MLHTQAVVAGVRTGVDVNDGGAIVVPQARLLFAEVVGLEERAKISAGE
jgi:hypothetical protein